MFDTLPKDYREVADWDWTQYQPYVDNLLGRDLNPDTLDAWMDDNNRLGELLVDTHNRLYVAHTVDTTIEAAEAAYDRFLSDIMPHMLEANNDLNKKLVASGLEPHNFEIPLRNIRAELALFREENLPLIIEEERLGIKYEKMIGTQTIMWEGEETTLIQLQTVFQEADRAKREKAWRMSMERRLQDRDKINQTWRKLLDLRHQIATNAGMSNFRDYKWQALHRFDYTPENCLAYHAAIEQVVVPVVEKLREKRRQQLGVESLRPWDLDVDPLGREPLSPYTSTEELDAKSARIFNAVDPVLGDYYALMQRENLLDLENRKGKAPGAYSIDFPIARVPFIFMNSVGVQRDVETMLHEGGHSFHTLAAAHLPYQEQIDPPMEFAEVASMSMELLGTPYLAEFYDEADTARSRIEHLEGILDFFPYMAVVDGFQHWAYLHADTAKDAAACDAKWGELWDRFMKGQDWSGLEAEKVTGWHRKSHLYTVPFYYIEYGLAQLGALQVWANALQDQAKAVASYLEGLSLGNTKTLPELYATAGAKFAFDAETLQSMVDLAVAKIEELEAV